MQHISTTPFGRRPVSAAIMAGQIHAKTVSDTAQIDKWTLFHDLCTARDAFGVTDRDLSVLNALLSFLPARELVDGAPLIVFPSNATLAARAHGLAESALRRHLTAQILDDMAQKLTDILIDVHHNLAPQTPKTAATDSQNERHHSNSNINIQESESCHEQDADPLPTIPLYLVLQACPDIAPYSRHPIRHWHDLVACANGVRGMLGISAETWQEAQRIMGAEAAAVVLSAMVQRVDKIRKPGGYLRKLTQQMAARTFTPGPMIMALLSGSRPYHG